MTIRTEVQSTGARRRIPQAWRVALGVVGALLLLFAAYWVWMMATFSFEGPPLAQEAALADFNGDGHLDVFVTISPNGEPYVATDVVLFGDGNGRFTDSGQRLENVNSFTVSAGDMNGDGAPEAVVGNLMYVNDGDGRFSRSHYIHAPVMGVFRWQTRPADLNGDGALDLFGAGCCGGARAAPVGPQETPLLAADLAWLNNGAGSMAKTGQSLGYTGSNDVALGDLDGDGDVDAFVASGQSTHPDLSVTSRNPNLVWLNDGSGQFSDSGQRLGQAESLAVGLGDLDGDGDLDAVVGNRGQDALWLNDGNGRFQPAPAAFSSVNTQTLFVVDLNGDSAPDLVLAASASVRVWLNRGDATFQRGQRIYIAEDDAVAVGDVTEDGIVDLLVVGVDSYRVWRGDGAGGWTAVSADRQPYHSQEEGE